MITAQQLSKSISYREYKTLIEGLLAQGKTTGHTQSPEYLDYAKINIQRMARLEKTTALNADLKRALQKINRQYTFVAITEGWCGDASQNLPIFDLIAKECPNISLKLVLRDENPELMDQYLTNGSRSIPKVIALENITQKELFVWGPRPALLQGQVTEMVKKGLSKAERGLAIQKWYNADKTQTLQAELLALIEECMN